MSIGFGTGEPRPRRGVILYPERLPHVQLKIGGTSGSRPVGTRRVSGRFCQGRCWGREGSDPDGRLGRSGESTSGVVRGPVARVHPRPPPAETLPEGTTHGVGGRTRPVLRPPTVPLWDGAPHDDRTQGGGPRGSVVLSHPPLRLPTVPTYGPTRPTGPTCRHSRAGG